MLIYKTNRYYAPSSERCIVWNDEAIGIKWENTGEPVLSDRDQFGKPLAQSEIFDELSWMPSDRERS